MKLVYICFNIYLVFLAIDCLVYAEDDQEVGSHARIHSSIQNLVKKAVNKIERPRETPVSSAKRYIEKAKEEYESKTKDKRKTYTEQKQEYEDKKAEYQRKLELKKRKREKSEFKKSKSQF